MSTNRYEMKLSGSSPVDRSATKLLYVSTAKYGGDWHSLLHTHACTEIFYVVGGVGQFKIEELTLPVTVDDMVIVNPNVEHTEVSLNASPLEYIVMGVEGLEFAAGEDGDGRYSMVNFHGGREDVLHYKAYTRDGIRGVSVLSRAAEVIGAGRAAQEYELAYYRNGGHPAGILTTQADLGGYVTVKDADGTERVISKKDRLREEWEKIHAGPSKGHRIAVLDLSAEYKPLSISNREAQFVEGKEISVKDIARFFGIPLYKLQEGKQAYSSNEQNAIEYVVSTLHPIVSQYEEEQTWKLLTDTELADGLELRINMMAELRGDFATRGAWHKGMRETGVFSVNDIRALEDLPDVEGGDERYASLNYVPLRSWAELSRQRAEKGGSSNARNA